MGKRDSVSRGFSRQAFEDAQHAQKIEAKRNMLQEIDQAETEYDFIFSVVIFLNLIFMGIETDYGDKDKTTGPWLAVESVFIVIYLVEFILRIRAVNRPLEEHEVQEREDRIRLSWF